MRSIESPYVEKGKLRSLLNKPSVKKKAEELLSLSRNQLRIMTGLLTGQCHLKCHLFNLGLENNPKCDIQADT